MTCYTDSGLVLSMGRIVPWRSDGKMHTRMENSTGTSNTVFLKQASSLPITKLNNHNLLYQSILHSNPHQTIISLVGQIPNPGQSDMSLSNTLHLCLHQCAKLEMSSRFQGR